VNRPAFALRASTFALRASTFALRASADKSARQAIDPSTTSRHDVVKMCVEAIDRQAKVRLQQTLCA